MGRHKLIILEDGSKLEHRLVNDPLSYKLIDAYALVHPQTPSRSIMKRVRAKVHRKLINNKLSKKLDNKLIKKLEEGKRG